jgi:5-methylthioadenosine/S-adenosylhomocysteine deaminase
MFAELRVAHVLQRVRGEPQSPRLPAAGVFGMAWDGGARVVGSGSAIGRLEPVRRGDVVVLDLRALSAPFTADGVDVWELLITRAKAAHVHSVVVDGRVLMQERRLQHIDRDALMQEVAGAAASAIARRSPQEDAWLEQVRHRIAEHYQAHVWHA